VLLAAASGLTIALLLVTALSRRVTRPLRLLARATQRVAEGDRSITMGHAGTVEIDRVATSFNRMVSELAERDRLARDFLMRVTHDLRTPLTAIRGHASALADGIVPEENIPRSLGAIESEAGRLESLVADLLDLAKMEADRIRLDLEEVDPADVVAQVCDLNQSVAAEREIRLERQLRSGLTLHTDSARVGQIVANLVDNALRWTPRGGLVTVLLRSGSGIGARVDVLDTGPGVPESEREAIFEAFRSAMTPDGQHGTGLGLATSRQLARALGGDLIVSDGPGGGSMFRLTLPIAAPAS
jgi:two-component system sensor histidine kinase BaeS